MFGTRVAVLAGDFLFAQSSWFLANLENLEVSQPVVFRCRKGKAQVAPWTPLVPHACFSPPVDAAGDQVDFPSHC
jgi:hypothetical protein